MQHKKLKLSAVFLLGLGLAGLQAQTIYVKEKSGTQTAYALNSIRKMTFSGGNATIQKTDNSTDVYTLSGIRYLNFKGLITGIVKPETQSGFSGLIIYPNPVTDVLYVDLTEEEGKGIISILTLEGREIQTQKIEGNSVVTINLSHLSQGIYLCRFSNVKGVKTVKIIKQ